jgi:hypothetical protein
MRSETTVRECAAAISVRSLYESSGGRERTTECIDWSAHTRVGRVDDESECDAHRWTTACSLCECCQCCASVRSYLECAHTSREGRRRVALTGRAEASGVERRRGGRARACDARRLSVQETEGRIDAKERGRRLRREKGRRRVQEYGGSDST